MNQLPCNQKWSPFQGIQKHLMEKREITEETTRKETRHGKNGRGEDGAQGEKKNAPRKGDRAQTCGRLWGKKNNTQKQKKHENVSKFRTRGQHLEKGGWGSKVARLKKETLTRGPFPGSF